MKHSLAFHFTQPCQRFAAVQIAGKGFGISTENNNPSFRILGMFESREELNAYARVAAEAAGTIFSVPVHASVMMSADDQNSDRLQAKLKKMEDSAKEEHEKNVDALRQRREKAIKQQQQQQQQKEPRCNSEENKDEDEDEALVSEEETPLPSTKSPTESPTKSSAHYDFFPFSLKDHRYAYAVVTLFRDPVTSEKEHCFRIHASFAMERDADAYCAGIRQMKIDMKHVDLYVVDMYKWVWPDRIFSGRSPPVRTMYSDENLQKFMSRLNTTTTENVEELSSALLEQTITS